MVAAAFEYVRVSSYEEAVQALGAYGEDAKVLAGGQSLVPMINLRLARPSHLIDITAVETAAIEPRGDWLRIPALTRQRTLMESSLVRQRCPLLPGATSFVGNVRVRNRGTLAGSLCHADPTGELACCVLALGARIHAVGPQGARSIAAEDFFVTFLTTALDAEEVVTAVDVPALPASPDRHNGAGHNTGWAFTEIARRASDFAVVEVAALVELDDANETVTTVRLALGGVADRPVLAKSAQAAMLGRMPNDALLDGAAEAAAAGADPDDDVHASGAYRKRMVRVLGRRALAAAVARARGEGEANQ